MSVSRVWALWRKDLALGPRSPVLLYALAMPVVLTLLLQGVFGNLFDRTPRLGIVDDGASALTAAAMALDGVRASRVATADELRAMVTTHDLDAGLVLPAGFDAAVRSGERPPLTFYVAGESRASHRVLLTVTALDLVRGLEGRAPTVEVAVVMPGGDALSLEARLVPFAVLITLVVAGVFVTSFGLVEEREKRTIDALLVTPVRLGEVLWAKGLLGGVLALLMATVTLALNGALVGQHPGLLAALLLGAVMAALIGLLYGLVSPDARSLFALFKTLNLVVMAPVLFYLFPDWPQWIAMLFPTYWVLDPIVAIAQGGATLGDVAPSLAIGLLLCAGLAALVAGLAGRLRAAHATGAA